MKLIYRTGAPILNADRDKHSIALHSSAHFATKYTADLLGITLSIGVGKILVWLRQNGQSGSLA
jgi:hypothetical protein